MARTVVERALIPALLNPRAVPCQLRAVELDFHADFPAPRSDEPCTRKRISSRNPAEDPSAVWGAGAPF